MTKNRKKAYTAERRRLHEEFERETLDGLSVGEIVIWDEGDKKFKERINRLIEHPEYGNWFECYSRSGGFRATATSRARKPRVKRARKKRENKNAD